jgi:hypothetical protein
VSNDQRHDTEYEGKGCHQNWPQAKPTGLYSR